MKSFKNINEAILQLRNVPSALRKSKDFSQFDRDIPPMRGYLRQLDTWSQIFSEIRQVKTLFTEWMSEKVKSFPVDVAESLKSWENFQEVQKGPTGPLLGQSGFDKLIDDLVNYNRAFSIKPDKLKLLEEAFELLSRRFFSDFKKISIYSVNYKDALLELPRGTVRGGPFYGKGKVVDHEIINTLGHHPSQVVQAFLSTDFILCVSGYRISGTPYLDEAKFRLVFIPDMFYQYFMNGITHVMMNHLKGFPSFCGWLNPLERESILKEAYLKAKEQGFKLIQLDYSAYDKHIHPSIQLLASQFFASAFEDWDKVEYSLTQKLSNQKILFFDKAGHPKFYTINNQLISGKSDTQLSGSLIGLMLSLSFLISKHGKEKAYAMIDFLFQLGDDTLFPVDASNQESYERVLLEYSEFVSHYGFTLNPKKAYPNSDAAFLQKLIRPDIGLDSMGTWHRSLMSFMFSEKFKVNKFGSTIALDIISQISILENAYGRGKYNFNDFFFEFIKFWVNKDEALYSLLLYLKVRGKSDGNSIFLALVNLAGLKSDTDVLKALDLLSYDHTGLKETLLTKDYGMVFHAIEAMSRYSYEILDETKGTIEFAELISKFKADPITEDQLSKEIVEE